MHHSEREDALRVDGYPKDQQSLKILEMRGTKYVRNKVASRGYGKQCNEKHGGTSKLACSATQLLCCASAIIPRHRLAVAVKLLSASYFERIHVCLSGPWRSKRLHCGDVVLRLRYRGCHRAQQGVPGQRLREMYGVQKASGWYAVRSVSSSRHLIFKLIYRGYAQVLPRMIDLCA